MDKSVIPEFNKLKQRLDADWERYRTECKKFKGLSAEQLNLCMNCFMNGAISVLNIIISRGWIFREGRKTNA